MFNPAWKSARTGTIFHYKKLSFYACEGLVAFHDARDGSYSIVIPDDLLDRAKAVERMIGHKPSEGNAAQRAFYRENARVVQDMREVVKEAKFMGDPSDPKVREFWAKHRPGSKSTISLSAGRNPEGYPELPEIPVGEYTGRTTDAGAEIPPEYRIHQPPRRKNRKGILLPASSL